VPIAALYESVSKTVVKKFTFSFNDSEKILVIVSLIIHLTLEDLSNSKRKKSGDTVKTLANSLRERKKLNGIKDATGEDFSLI